MRGTAASSDWRYSHNLHAAREKGTKRSSSRRSTSLETLKRDRSRNV